MPNPASSGTGYLTIAAWLQIMGEEAGWKYMDALHQNIAQYIHSGSAPCVQAAKGERLIGIGLDTRGASEKTKGAPLELIDAEGRPGLGARGDRHRQGHQEPRRRQEARRLGRLRRRPTSSTPRPIRSWPTRASPSTPPNYPPNLEKVMVKNDVEWMAKNRDRILAEWTKRYDGKSAPKANKPRGIDALLSS